MAGNASDVIFSFDTRQEAHVEIRNAYFDVHKEYKCLNQNEDRRMFLFRYSISNPFLLTITRAKLSAEGEFAIIDEQLKYSNGALRTYNSGEDPAFEKACAQLKQLDEVIVVLNDYVAGSTDRMRLKSIAYMKELDTYRADLSTDLKNEHLPQSTRNTKVSLRSMFHAYITSQQWGQSSILTLGCWITPVSTKSKRRNISIENNYVFVK